MKNIHLLPTDKPSRLFDFMTALVLTDKVSPNDSGTNQHIFITNDEDIKEGDWMYYKHFGENIICKYDTMGGQNTNVNEHKDFYKKIILTTDQDLIADGIQSIDDEFLEWFVKNPSCEKVEVNRDWGYPKIIIPKEEPKQNFILVKEACPCTDECLYYLSKQCKHLKELSKDDTLEEAERLYPINNTGSMFMPNSNELNNSYKQEGFIEGAKWQQERMYNEEDMKQFGLYLGENLKALKCKQIDDIFEQFKKKL